MKTAKEIIQETFPNMIYRLDGLMQGNINANDIVSAINIAREETIAECAERAKIIWIDDDYNEELRDMNRHAEIDKSSILNIIKELK
jgi:hypothetical protein